MRYHKARRKELLERLEWKKEYDRARDPHSKLPLLWTRAGFALQLALLELGMLHDLYYANFTTCRALSVVRHGLSFIRAALTEIEKSINAYQYNAQGYEYKQIIKIEHIRIFTPKKSNAEIQGEWDEQGEAGGPAPAEQPAEKVDDKDPRPEDRRRPFVIYMGTRVPNPRYISRDRYEELQRAQATPVAGPHETKEA